MEKLTELRKEHELTQRELAEKLGVAQNTISAWEKGIREPDFKTVIEICKIFDISMDALIKNSEEYGVTENKIDELKTQSKIIKAYFNFLNTLPPEQLAMNMKLTAATNPKLYEILQSVDPEGIKLFLDIDFNNELKFKETNE